MSQIDIPSTLLMLLYSPKGLEIVYNFSCSKFDVQKIVIKERFEEAKHEGNQNHV